MINRAEQVNIKLGTLLASLNPGSYSYDQVIELRERLAAVKERLAYQFYARPRASEFELALSRREVLELCDAIDQMLASATHGEGRV
jgi:hypothetical protein